MTSNISGRTRARARCAAPRRRPRGGPPRTRRRRDPGVERRRRGRCRSMRRSRRRSSWRDDSEAGIDRIDHGYERLQHRRVAVVGRLVEISPGQQLHQLWFGQCDGQRHVGRGCIALGYEHTVAQRRAPVLVDVGEAPVDHEIEVPGLGPVDADRNGVEDLLDRQCRNHVPIHQRQRRRFDTVAQLLRTHQVEVAPGAVLGAVAERRVRRSQECSRGGVVGLREHDVIEQLDGKPQITVIDIGLCPLHHRVGTSHRLDVARRPFDRRVLPQVGGVAVEPAHVPLVDGLHVVAHRAVVAVRVPRRFERGRHLHHLGGLDARVALVDEPQRLVVEIAIEVSLLRASR